MNNKIPNYRPESIIQTFKHQDTNPTLHSNISKLQNLKNSYVSTSTNTWILSKELANQLSLFVLACVSSESAKNLITNSKWLVNSRKNCFLTWLVFTMHLIHTYLLCPQAETRDELHPPPRPCWCILLNRLAVLPLLLVVSNFN